MTGRNQQAYFVCVSRGARGRLCSFRWAGCAPRDPAHSGSAGDRRWSVQLCGQQHSWNLCWHCYPAGWRLDRTSAFLVRLIFFFFSTFIQRKNSSSPTLPFHSGPIVLWSTGWRGSQRRGEYHPPLRCPRFPAADADLAQTGRQTGPHKDRQPQ